MPTSATHHEYEPTSKKQADRISKPDEEAHQKQLEDINNTIDKLKEELVNSFFFLIFSYLGGLQNISS